MHGTQANADHEAPSVTEGARPRLRVRVPAVFSSKGEPGPRAYGLAVGVIVGGVLGTLLGGVAAVPLGGLHHDPTTTMALVALVGALLSGVVGALLASHVARNLAPRPRDERIAGVSSSPLDQP